MNFYDIHTHILPGLDDGSKSLEQTEMMLRMEIEQGVKHIIATPHYTRGEYVSSPEKQREMLEKVREIARKTDKEMTIDLGNEIYDIKDCVEQIKSGKVLTMANTRYILVEFLPGDAYKNIYQTMNEYIREGYIPIMAHMERYEALEKRYDRLEELSKMGIYFQMNTSSLQGGIFDRKAAYHRRLVEEGYIQFLGSDCHRSDKRVPLMKDALKYFSKGFRQSKTLKRILYENPEALLADEYIR